MRRHLAALLIASAVLTGSLAWAAETTPPADASSGSEQSAFKQPDAMLDKSGHQRSQMLSFFLGFPWGHGLGGFPLGIGARYYIPILHDGFVPQINDSFGIEFGADLHASFGGWYVGTFFGFGIPVEARWGVHLIPAVEVYAKVGFGIGYSSYNIPFVNNVYPYFVSQLGIVYKLTDKIALRAEVGYPSALKGGIGISF